MNQKINLNNSILVMSSYEIGNVSGGCHSNLSASIAFMVGGGISLGLGILMAINPCHLSETAYYSSYTQVGNRITRDSYQTSKAIRVSGIFVALISAATLAYGIWDATNYDPDCYKSNFNK